MLPALRVRGGVVIADSRDVAAAFEKRHADVLRAIREVVAGLPIEAQRKFAPFKINDLTGESTSHYEMDRDGFSLLAMGFTGAKALVWQRTYIKAFNRMESELRAAPLGDQREPTPGRVVGA